MSMLLSKTSPSRLLPWVGYVLCGIGFLICLTAFYPGYMSPDSLDQWSQGVQWVFWDYHPPVMSALWGILGRIIPGPFGMLLVHNAVFWGAAAVLWRHTWRKSLPLGLGFVTLGYLPPLLAVLSTIWKDVGLGVSLFMVVALLYAANKTLSKTLLIVSSIFLFYGYSVRLNAARLLFRWQSGPPLLPAGSFLS